MTRRLEPTGPDRARLLADLIGQFRAYVPSALAERRARQTAFLRTWHGVPGDLDWSGPEYTRAQAAIDAPTIEAALAAWYGSPAVALAAEHHDRHDALTPRAGMALARRAAERAG